METCTVCFGTFESAMRVDHLRFHKAHNHHMLGCASLYDSGAGNPRNPCTCPMLSVWV